MFESELKFLVEIDKLKSVQRKTLILDGSRYENTAEHSWNLAMAVLLFSAAANEEVSVPKALKMAIIHDLVEVYAGDTFIYDEQGGGDQFEREAKALESLLSVLGPTSVSDELRSLWHEFEQEKSAESKFVKALDRLLPLMQNWKNGGHSWKMHDIREHQVLEKNKKIEKGSAALWQLALKLIQETKDRGDLKS